MSNKIFSKSYLNGLKNNDEIKHEIKKEIHSGVIYVSKNIKTSKKYYQSSFYSIDEKDLKEIKTYLKSTFLECKITAIKIKVKRPFAEELLHLKINSVKPGLLYGFIVDWS